MIRELQSHALPLG